MSSWRQIAEVNPLKCKTFFGKKFLVIKIVFVFISSISRTMSAKDSFPRKQSSNSRINKQNAYRVLSHELQSPSTDLLRSRYDDTQIFCAREAGGSHFRSQSEIVYSLQERDGSLIRDNQRCQEFCPSNGRNFHESKLPKITQGDAATNKHLVGDWKAIATDSIKRSLQRARVFCQTYQEVWRRW